jgi:hypothetical protein
MRRRVRPYRGAGGGSGADRTGAGTGHACPSAPARPQAARSRRGRGASRRHAGAGARSALPGVVVAAGGLRGRGVRSGDREPRGGARHADARDAPPAAGAGLRATPFGYRPGARGRHGALSGRAAGRRRRGRARGRRARAVRRTGPALRRRAARGAGAASSRGRRASHRRRGPDEPAAGAGAGRWALRLHAEGAVHGCRALDRTAATQAPRHDGARAPLPGRLRPGRCAGRRGVAGRGRPGPGVRAAALGAGRRAPTSPRRSGCCPSSTTSCSLTPTAAA